MRKSLLFASLIPVAFSLFISGCKKNAVPQEPSVQEEETYELPEPSDLIEEKLIPSVVLSSSAGLNLLGRDNRMHRMKTLSLGDSFEAVQVNGLYNPLNLYDEKENPETYIQVLFDNVDFWIFENYIAKNAASAIIVSPVNGLRTGTVVGLSLEEKPESVSETDAESDSETAEEKVKIFWFDKAQNKVVEGLVDSDKVSTYTDDIRMAEIIEKLKTTTRATPRNELFRKAEKLNASPNMKRMLDAQKTETLSYDYQEVLKTMPGARYIVNVEELNTVDQSKDPFKN